MKSYLLLSDIERKQSKNRKGKIKPMEKITFHTIAALVVSAGGPQTE